MTVEQGNLNYGYDSDIVGELRDVKSVNFHNLDEVKKSNPELYAQMAKAGIVVGEK